MDKPIRGRTRELTNKVEATVPMNIHNRFDVEVIDSRTGKIRQRAQAENVICNRLWTKLFSGYSNSYYFAYIHYGTGTGTPASTDTSLFTYLGNAAAGNMEIKTDPANCVYSCTKKIQLAESTAVGASLTEVGIGYDTGASTLCTHAMLKDMNGNQISIAKTSTDIINIYATIYVHWVTALNNGSVRLLYNAPLLAWATGNSSTYAYNQQYPRYFSTAKGIKKNAPSGIDNGSVTTQNNATTKTLTLTIARIAASAGNMRGGIGCINFYSYDSPSYYPSIAVKVGSDWFAGSTITGEAVGTGDGSTVDFATGFDFPQNATIYVNGVAASEATIDNAPATNSDMGSYFDGIIAIDGVAYPKEYTTLSAYQVDSNHQYGALGDGTYYNPYYAAGIKSFVRNGVNKVEVSNDLVNWAVLTLASTTTVPETYRKYKYWRVTVSSSTDVYGIYNLVADTYKATNIHFTTPPASGAVITADYHTPVIAKDANHVFDMTVTIQLGEYSA